MNHQIDDIKRRHKERKDMMLKNKSYSPQNQSYYPQYPDESNLPDGIHPLFNPQRFFLKFLIASVLVLLAGVLYKQPVSTFPDAKKVVQKTFNTEFNFATMSAWYQQTFGKPLAFLPTMPVNKKQSTKAVTQTDTSYAVPVTGTITQTFGTTGQGIYLKTGVGSTVEAVKDGFVASIETKNKIGKTIVIQHTNGTETWYGELNNVNVKLYDFVKKGQKIGTVSKGDGKSGAFYFAIKKGDSFVDPIQVINFG